MKKGTFFWIIIAVIMSAALIIIYYETSKKPAPRPLASELPTFDSLILQSAISPNYGGTMRLDTKGDTVEIETWQHSRDSLYFRIFTFGCTVYSNMFTTPDSPAVWFVPFWGEPIKMANKFDYTVKCECIQSAKKCKLHQTSGSYYCTVCEGDCPACQSDFHCFTIIWYDYKSGAVVPAKVLKLNDVVYE